MRDAGGLGEVGGAVGLEGAGRVYRRHRCRPGADVSASLLSGWISGFYMKSPDFLMIFKNFVKSLQARLAIPVKLSGSWGADFGSGAL